MRILGMGAAACALAAFALSVSAPASGADASLGKNEYQARCAMCHGAGGKGDGWLADNLLQRPPSLTQLKKKNGGVFPAAKVGDIIYGRQQVKLHGPREMPVWGDVYREEQEAAGNAKSGKPAVDEHAIRAKIRALTDYLSQLQE